MNNISLIQITWQPLTLVEARSFIDYIVTIQLNSFHDGGQSSSQRVAGDQNSTVVQIDPVKSYVITVGTVVISTGQKGPGKKSPECVTSYEISYVVSEQFSVLLVIRIKMAIVRKERQCHLLIKDPLHEKSTASLERTVL